MFRSRFSHRLLSYAFTPARSITVHDLFWRRILRILAIINERHWLDSETRFRHLHFVHITFFFFSVAPLFCVKVRLSVRVSKVRSNTHGLVTYKKPRHFGYDIGARMLRR